MALPNWYFMKDDKVVGPVLEKRMLEMLKDGTLTSETPVSSLDMPDWKPAGQKFSTAANPSAPVQRTKSSEMTVGQALFSFTGRMSRSEFWLKGILVLLPFGILNTILAYGVATDGARAVSTIFALISFWPVLALIVKRLHDRDYSGWYALGIFLITPIVGPIWLLIEVAFIRGTPGPNRFEEYKDK